MIKNGYSHLDGIAVIKPGESEKLKQILKTKLLLLFCSLQVPVMLLLHLMKAQSVVGRRMSSRSDVFLLLGIAFGSFDG